MTHGRLVYPLPVEDLLYVGPATKGKLNRRFISTIGDLAEVSADTMKHWLGKVGLMLRMFARGEATSPVMPYVDDIPIKSIGNSTTTPVDMETAEDVKGVFTLLAESVAARMREAGFRSRYIHIFVRRAEDLASFGCHRTIQFPTSLTWDFVKVAMELFYQKGYDRLLPMRSIGISCGSLSLRSMPTQMDLFGDEERRSKQEMLEDTVYWLKQRYGQKSIERGICGANQRLREINI